MGLIHIFRPVLSIRPHSWTHPQILFLKNPTVILSEVYQAKNQVWIGGIDFCLCVEQVDPTRQERRLGSARAHLTREQRPQTHPLSTIATSRGILTFHFLAPVYWRFNREESGWSNFNITRHFILSASGRSWIWTYTQMEGNEEGTRVKSLVYGRRLLFTSQSPSRCRLFWSLYIMLFLWLEIQIVVVGAPWGKGRKKMAIFWKRLKVSK